MDWEGEVKDNPDDPDILQGHAHAHGHGSGDEDENKERCVICLMALRDRTIVGVCGHEFCVCRPLSLYSFSFSVEEKCRANNQFECIGVWANQSRKCPLCSAEMAPFLLHDLDSSVPTKVRPSSYLLQCAAVNNLEAKPSSTSHHYLN